MQGVRGYPTIMALSPGSTTWSEYQGDRGAASISNWATSLIGNAAVNIKKESDLQTFLARCSGGSSSSSKDATKDTAAAWGLCLLLSSDKSSQPSLWKALSVAYKGKVAFGFIGSSAAAGLAAKVGVEGKESKVVSVCNGDMRTAEVFKGEPSDAKRRETMGDGWWWWLRCACARQGNQQGRRVGSRMACLMTCQSS